MMATHAAETGRALTCRAFLLVFAMFVASSCFAQEFTVRVINAADARPMQNVTVVVSVPFGHYSVRRETDADGGAHFAFPDPAPARIRVDAILSPEHWDCGCLAGATSEYLIQKGVVAPPGRKQTKIAASLKPTPGQFLFAMRRLSFLESLRAILGS